MRNRYDLPIYFIIIGLMLNIILGLYAKASFNALMLRSIVVIILFGIMGYAVAEVFHNASKEIKKNRKKAAMAEVAEEAATGSSIDIRAEAEDEDALLKTLSRYEDEDNVLEDILESEEEFMEINPEDFKTFMNRE